ncbi:MAG: hypothetical protein D3905_14320 [Candidatus Electrothrix sp. AS4_5]|nr:hypothetical protein [Candidatus Electrothrix gigas]
MARKRSFPHTLLAIKKQESIPQYPLQYILTMCRSNKILTPYIIQNFFDKRIYYSLIKRYTAFNMSIGSDNADVFGIFLV